MVTVFVWQTASKRLVKVTDPARAKFGLTKDASEAHLWNDKFSALSFSRDILKKYPTAKLVEGEVTISLKLK